MCIIFFYFFFQAEDGIRDRNVTGVQTCALPILFKQQLLTLLLRDRLLNQHMQLEQECQQLLFEQRKVQNKTKLSKREVTRRFQEEIDNRQEKINMIEFKMKQLEMLEIGSEIVETEVEALVEVT